jgi:protein involved in polysaccharide export with SLBB domain
MLSLRSLLAFAFLFFVLPAGAQNFSSYAGTDIQSNALRVTVMGVVRQPTEYLWQPGLRIMQMLAVCGGLTVPAKEVTATLMTNEGSKAIPINLPALLAGTNSKQNLPLVPGDILVLTRTETGKVDVIGEVDDPGSYVVSKTGASALALLYEAGGSKPEGALSRAQVLHENVVQTDDLRRLPNNQPLHLRLFPGDTLLIPTRGRVIVWGASQRPMDVLLPDGKSLTVAQVLAMITGLNADADENHIFLYRNSGAKIAGPIHIGLNDELKAGDTLIVSLMRSRRTLKVPSRPEPAKARAWLIHQ